MEKMHGDYRTEPYAFRNRDSALYEHTFLPLVPFSFKGIIWYQGESDTTIEESKIYKEFLKRLIQTWRKDLDDEEMPFVIVQICDYVYRDDEGWKGIQKAQEEFAQENKGHQPAAYIFLSIRLFELPQLSMYLVHTLF